MRNKFYYTKQLSLWKERSLNHNNAQFKMQNISTKDNYLGPKAVMDKKIFIISYLQIFRITSTPMNAILTQKTLWIPNLNK